MNVITKNEWNVNGLKTIAEDILKEAKMLGADQAEINIDANKGFSVTATNGEVETVEYNQDKSIEITVYFGKRSGTACISDISKDAIKKAIAAASHIAKFTDEDPASGLAEKEEMAFQYPDVSVFFPWDLSVERAIELAVQVEKEALAIDNRIIISEESKVGTISAFSLYANSHGFIGYYPVTHHEISCVLVAKEKQGMQRDYSYTMSPDPSLLASVSQVAKEAADRTLSRLGAKSIQTTRAPVIFAAEEARGFLGHFAASIQGNSIYRKSSFMLDKIDQQIFPKFVQLQELPHLPRGYGTAPFDDDGVATRPNIFVADGRLQGYALSVYSARKLGMKTTGNAGGLHNLTITPGSKNFAELIKTMDRGLVITELMGQGVNLLTGDYSRGAAGYWVENGEIQFPVHEVTVASNLMTMFQNIVEIGNDVDMRGNVRTGSLLISDMMIAGN